MAENEVHCISTDRMPAFVTGMSLTHLTEIFFVVIYLVSFFSSNGFAAIDMVQWWSGGIDPRYSFVGELLPLKVISINLEIGQLSVECQVINNINGAEIESNVILIVNRYSGLNLVGGNYFEYDSSKCEVIDFFESALAGDLGSKFLVFGTIGEKSVWDWRAAHHNRQAYETSSKYYGATTEYSVITYGPRFGEYGCSFCGFCTDYNLAFVQRNVSRAVSKVGNYNFYGLEKQSSKPKTTEVMAYQNNGPFCQMMSSFATRAMLSGESRIKNDHQLVKEIAVLFIKHKDKVKTIGLLSLINYDAVLRKGGQYGNFAGLEALVVGAIADKIGHHRELQATVEFAGRCERLGINMKNNVNILKIMTIEPSSKIERLMSVNRCTASSPSPGGTRSLYA
jgi:hypothetical protein